MKTAKREEQELVNKWAYVPQGTDVIVTKDDKSEVRTKTRSAAFLLSGHTACIMVEGISGAYRLNRVRKA